MRSRRRFALRLLARTRELLVCAAIYAVGQGSNVLFQILLARHFGLLAYSDIGLAHLLFVLATFIADLGYSSLFLRDDPCSPGWMRDWRLALGHKLVAALLFYAAALGGWVTAYGPHGEGLVYLAATVPATLASLACPWPRLLAQGRRVAAFMIQQAPWPAAVVLWWALVSPDALALQAGLVVTAGFTVQLVAGLVIGGGARLLLPRFGANGPMLRSALSLSVMGIVGALHDRLTPFLIARLVPDFLPVLLLLSHGMNGISGVVVQINRLLLPQLTTARGRRQSHRVSGLLLLAMALGFQALLMVSAFAGERWPNLSPHLMLPTILAWSIATISSFSATELIGQRRESELLRILLVGIACSVGLQIATAALSWGEGVLWARVLSLVGMTAVTLHACGIRLGWTGWALCGSLAMASMAANAPWLWASSVVLVAVAGVAVAFGAIILNTPEPAERKQSA